MVHNDRLRECFRSVFSSMPSYLQRPQVSRMLLQVWPQFKQHNYIYIHHRLHITRLQPSAGSIWLSGCQCCVGSCQRSLNDSSGPPCHCCPACHSCLLCLLPHRWQPAQCPSSALSIALHSSPRPPSLAPVPPAHHPQIMPWQCFT